MFRISILSVAIGLSTVSGCSKSGSSPAPQKDSGVNQESVNTIVQPVALETLSETQLEQKNTAIAAKDALFAKLSGRLMSVMQSDGPAQAVSVCKSEAPAFGEQVEQEFGVEIGRTSFKLRNSTNTVPDWASEFVTARTAEPTFVSLSDNRLGALFPIRLKQKCTVCHGERDSLSEEVRAALDLQYPVDEATGFKEGDLRGWFWVDVPVGSDSQRS